MTRFRNRRSADASRERQKEEEKQLELNLQNARIEHRLLKAETDLMYAKVRGMVNALEATTSPAEARKQHPELYEALAAIRKVMDDSLWAYKERDEPEMNELGGWGRNSGVVL